MVRPDLYGMPETNAARLQAEIERLRAELTNNEELRTHLVALIKYKDDEIDAWHECAQYDPLMEGPRFKGWDRSALDRCRRRFIDCTA